MFENIIIKMRNLISSLVKCRCISLILCGTLWQNRQHCLCWGIQKDVDVESDTVTFHFHRDMVQKEIYIYIYILDSIMFGLPQMLMLDL